MCGIFASFGKHKNLDISAWCEFGLEILHRRGPDSSGLLQISDSKVFLGATRLAMVGLDEARQPLTLSESLTIVWNGEIYNYLDLADYIQNSDAKGSDTICFVELFKDYSLGCLPLINGTFSALIVDWKQKSFFLFRDANGKKPLYITNNGEGFLVSSSRSHLSVSLNNNAENKEIINYLNLGFFTDRVTSASKISTVIPGTWQKHNLSGELLESGNHYYSPTSSSKNSSDFAQLRKLILDSVERRVSGQKDIALSMSGGVDSTLISLVLRELGISFHAYTLSWADSDKKRYNFDAEQAVQICQELKIPITRVSGFTTSDLPSFVKEYVSVMDEPNNNPTGVSMLPLYDAMKADGIRMALTGDGADELFGGYPRYDKVKSIPEILAILFLSPISKSKTLSRKLFPSFWSRFHLAFGKRELIEHFNFDSSDINSYFNLFSRYFDQEQVWLKSVHSETLVEKFAKWDSNIWLVNESNRRLDRVAMSRSIEPRCPFQDYELSHFVVKSRFLRDFGDSHKELLKHLFPELRDLPLLERKSGFISPIGHWVRSNREEINQSISKLIDRGVLKSQSNEQFMATAHISDFKLLRQIWTLYILSEWIESLE